jgi:hypothetical protein
MLPECEPFSRRWPSWCSWPWLAHPARSLTALASRQQKQRRRLATQWQASGQRQKAFSSLTILLPCRLDSPLCLHASFHRQPCNPSSRIRPTSRARGVPLTRRLQLIGCDRMRTLPLPLVGVVLIAVAPCRAEYDAAGASAKPKATGAAFDAGMAANPRAEKRSLIAEEAAFVRFAAMRAMLLLKRPVVVPGMQPKIKNPSNVPRPRRPADQPLSIDW